MSGSSSSNQPQAPASLRDRRIALGVTRAELAVKAKCSVTSLYYIEQGATRKGITRDKIIRTLIEMEKAA